MPLKTDDKADRERLLRQIEELIQPDGFCCFIFKKNPEEGDYTITTLASIGLDVPELADGISNALEKMLIDYARGASWLKRTEQ